MRSLCACVCLHILYTVRVKCIGVSKPWFVCIHSVLFGCDSIDKREKRPLTCFTNYKIGNPSHSFSCNVWHSHLTNNTTSQLFILSWRSLFASLLLPPSRNIMKWCFTCNLQIYSREKEDEEDDEKKCLCCFRLLSVYSRRSYYAS